MKVQTDLRAGGFFQDVGSQAGTAVDKTSRYVAKANRQAESFTNSVVNKATSFWNCLTR